MIGWSPIREFYSHLREANPDFDSHAVTGRILSAFFKGEESVFPHPDDGTESKSPFRIANWETIGAPSPELKSFLDTHNQETNQSINEHEKEHYKHHSYYHQNRLSLHERIFFALHQEKDDAISSRNQEWNQFEQSFSESRFYRKITTYFINTIEIRNAAAYAAINHFGWAIPRTWIESFCIDLDAAGKPGPKTGQVKATPGIWLPPIIEDGWHTPAPKGQRTAATMIHHLFCPEINPDTIRTAITNEYRDALAEQNRKVVLHTNTTID